MTLTGELLQEISSKFFESTDAAPEVPPEHLGRTLADALYGAPDMKAASLPETEGRELLTAGFATALRHAETCAKEIADTKEASMTRGATELLLATLATIATLSAATAHSDDTLLLPWKSEAWTDALVRCLIAEEASVAAFPLHAAIVNVILTLVRTPALKPAVQRNRRHLVEALASKVRQERYAHDWMTRR